MRLQQCVRGCAMALAIACGVANGTVADRAPQGFTVRHTLEIGAAPARVYAAVTQIGKWWNPEHSYSGDAAALTLSTTSGGCFCEALPGGGHVRHMSVVYVDPGKALRLSGGLGPLQPLGVAGSMDFKFDPAAQDHTKLEFTYAVGGYTPTGLDQLADPVDRVLLEQLERLKRFVETGKPVTPP
jgi:uncharacterized protein YndB with AHSA1/START domain